MLKAIAAKACKAGFAGILGAVVVSVPVLADARQSVFFAPAPATIAVAQLPPQGRSTYALIRQGGPFPYDKDGAVFGNRERLLPAYKRGHYREYTVATPGVRHRGARRIVCGGQPRLPDACYYTADHSNSFRQITQ